MLRGMGFSNNTAIYLASGRIYKAEKNMSPLLEMFPLLQTKETLALDEELAPFKVYRITAFFPLYWPFLLSIYSYNACLQNFSSRMAAIDYSVCVHSEVFVTTQGGNFPHFLIGHRRYLYGGHAKTIKPDKRRLAILFDSPRIGYVITVIIRWLVLFQCPYILNSQTWNFQLVKFQLWLCADGSHWNGNCSIWEHIVTWRVLK